MYIYEISHISECRPVYKISNYPAGNERKWYLELRANPLAVEQYEYDSKKREYYEERNLVLQYTETSTAVFYKIDRQDSVYQINRSVSITALHNPLTHLVKYDYPECYHKKCLNFCIFGKPYTMLFDMPTRNLPMPDDPFPYNFPMFFDMMPNLLKSLLHTDQYIQASIYLYKICQTIYHET